MSSISSKLMLFITVFLLTFAGGALSYAILASISEEGHVFGALYRMFLYHKQYPYQYIGLVAVIFAGIVSAIIPKCRRFVLWKRVLASVAVMLAAILVASGPGGVLWKIHDMQAGYFPHGTKLLKDLTFGFVDGIQIGWLVIVLSFPYNIICLIGGFFVVETSFRLSERFEPKSSQ